jgi:hypothetical protein
VPPLTTPTEQAPAEAFDPTADLRELYRAAELDLLAAIADAVNATLAAPDPAAAQDLVVAQLRRRARGVVARLNDAVPPMVVEILAAAEDEGTQMGEAETGT